METKYTAEEYLKMNSDELYDHLINYVLTSPDSEPMLMKLKETERYRSSYEFRLMVDFAGVLKYSSQPAADLTKHIVNCIDLIERATALEIWQVVATAWNSMGASYTKMGMFEKSFECYGHALRVESEHGLFKISPVVYGNAVIILNQIDDVEKGLEYLERALRLLEERGESIPRYWSHYTATNSLYLQLRLRKEQNASQEELKMYFDRVMAIPEDKINRYAQEMRLRAEFYYAFHFYEPVVLQEVMARLKKNQGEQNYILFIHQCIQLCAELGRDPEPYIEELIELDERGVVHLAFPNTYTYDILMSYYQERGNEAKLNEVRIKYIQNVKDYLESLSEQQMHSLHTIEQLVMSDSFRSSNNVKNVEFKLMAEETLKMKRELEEKNAILARISSMDGLTQISSRRDFDERFQNLLDSAIDSESSVTVFMVDIDNFKKYNDTYGHLEGDEVLKRVAKVFRECLDTVGALSARFGGEEFIGAAASLSFEQAEGVARRICEDIRNLGIAHDASEIGVVTICVGVAYAEHAKQSSKSQLMKLADECLYKSKNAGKNCFVINNA